MPKLVASSGSVIVTEPAAHHYRFVGIEFGPARGTFLHDLVQLGLNHTNVDAVPHHIIFDRCYLHGDPQRDPPRHRHEFSASTAVIDSYLSDFKEAGADSQAIAGWNGPGPFKIANNFLEAAGENMLFGGADPSIPDLVPADIEIRGNHLAKPLRWRAGNRDFEGTQWSVKNLFELKNARRVIVEGNVFEYNWPQSQNGFAILFTVRNQDGAAPWSVVEDVTFANNVVRHVACGINVLGRDDIHPSRRTARIAIRNNLFLDVGGQWGGGRLFQLLDGTSDISIDRNTAFQSDSLLFGGDHAPHTGFVFQDNIALHNRYGIIGSGTAHRPPFARSLLPWRGGPQEPDRRRPTRAVPSETSFRRPSNRSASSLRKTATTASPRRACTGTQARTGANPVPISTPSPGSTPFLKQDPLIRPRPANPAKTR